MVAKKKEHLVNANKDALAWIPVSLVILIISACQPDNPSATANSNNSNTVSGLRLSNILGEPNNEGFARADNPRTFTFPTDHGPHNQYRSEWWYLTAALKDEQGNEYGVHYTLFRQALSPTPTGNGPWHTGQAYLGHLAVTDISNKQHLEAERFARGHPELAGVTVNDENGQFHALIEDWILQGTAKHQIDLALSADALSNKQERFGVDLKIQQQGPVVLQGHRGLSKKGPGSASFYYSIPRMPMSGTINVDGQNIKVSGLGWLDREWSTSVLAKGLSGWDWFSLQLDDERSIMAFRLRRDDGERDDFDHGLLVDHNQLEDNAIAGEGDPGVKMLTTKDFSLEPTRYFEDARGVHWPVSWTLNLTNQELANEQLTINALLDQQTVDLSIVYWEGLVEVVNASNERLGLGYMELTGY